MPVSVAGQEGGKSRPECLLPTGVPPRVGAGLHLVPLLAGPQQGEPELLLDGVVVIAAVGREDGEREVRQLQVSPPPRVARARGVFDVADGMPGVLGELSLQQGAKLRGLPVGGSEPNAAGETLKLDIRTIDAVLEAAVQLDLKALPAEPLLDQHLVGLAVLRGHSRTGSGSRPRAGACPNTTFARIQNLPRPPERAIHSRVCRLAEAPRRLPRPHPRHAGGL